MVFEASWTSMMAVESGYVMLLSVEQEIFMLAVTGPTPRSSSISPRK
jgi:hypothetical protein